MRRTIAWTIVVLVLLSIPLWGEEVKSYTRYRTSPWVPLLRAINRSDLYTLVVPDPLSIGPGQSNLGDLSLVCSPRSGGAVDCFACSSSPAAEQWARDLADQTLASSNLDHVAAYGGTFVFSGEGWVVLWQGPVARADAARGLLEAFATPGQGNVRRTLRDLVAELRICTHSLTPNYPVEINRADLFFAYYHRVLCAPVILVVRVAAVLVPAGPVWAWVGQGLAFTLLLGLAAIIGRGFGAASKQPPSGRRSESR